MVSSRYSRQELFAGLGSEGQARLGGSRVLVLGCGALGSALAEMAVRAGIGSVRLVDRDYVELSNLQRQSLFEERDAEESLPKAKAAEARLRRLNAEVEVEGLVTDFDAHSAASLLGEADLVLDGTDNFETRFLLNDVCVRQGVPWVYGACVGAYGLALAIRPGSSPCLRCVLEEQPPAGSSPTCDTVGVVSPIVHVVAGLQMGEALKLLAGRVEALLPGIVAVDLWEGRFDLMELRGRKPWCPACTEGRFDYLERPPGAAVLCGRDAIQVKGQPGVSIDLEALAERLGRAGQVVANDYLLRFRSPEAALIVFRDGRAIVKGVADVSQARALYARYVGS